MRTIRVVEGLHDGALGIFGQCPFHFTFVPGSVGRAVLNAIVGELLPVDLVLVGDKRRKTAGVYDIDS